MLADLVIDELIKRVERLERLVLGLCQTIDELNQENRRFQRTNDTTSADWKEGEDE